MALRGHIIIADDNDDQRDLLALLLEREGFEVSQAYDGRGLLELVVARAAQGAASSITLVISDIMMPEMSGFDALEALRRARVEVPFIFISALRDPQTQAHARGIGALGVLTKPFDLNALRHVLSEVTAVSAA